VRVPRRVQELHLEIGRLVGALSQELGRSPTPSELAQRAGVDEERVIEAMEAGGMYQLTSLDAPSSSGADTSAPDEFATLDQRMAIEEMLATLPARERTIVELRFFDGLTQSEIAERVGISQMHVSRLLARSLNTLRDAAEA
jgi:RNA polymerase sigma-B factor